MDWDVKRWLRHEWVGKRELSRALPKEALDRLTQHVAASEKRHGGELRLVLEGALELPWLWRGLTARDRALQVFSEYRVWDTEANNGVLVYLLFADRRVEIVADRGIDRIVGAGEWSRICRDMEATFRRGEFEKGLCQGIDAITGHLEKHFPHLANDENELPDAPIVLP